MLQYSSAVFSTLGVPMVKFTLQEYQNMGYETDSVVNELPSNDEVMKWARDKIAINIVS